MIPIFIAPLTSRGIALVKLVYNLEAEFGTQSLAIYSDKNISQHEIAISSERIVTNYDESFEAMVTRTTYVAALMEVLTTLFPPLHTPSQ